MKEELLMEMNFDFNNPTHILLDVYKRQGIYEPLELIWNEICRWKLEGEINGWC